MKDIFDAKILCQKCDIQMQPSTIDKSGFKLRIIKCPKCNDKIFHPSDLSYLQHYNDLKRKTYTVKLRIVGNSHAVSIPKEIVEFINQTNRGMNRHMNDMVKLCFEDFGKLSLRFFDEEKRKW